MNTRRELESMLSLQREDKDNTALVLRAWVTSKSLSSGLGVS